MSCECRCQCSCNEKDIPFSEMTREQQKDLRKKACSGLPKKFLKAEDLKHRNKLERAIALDDKKRRDAHKIFLDMVHD